MLTTVPCSFLKNQTQTATSRSQPVHEHSPQMLPFVLSFLFVRVLLFSLSFQFSWAIMRKKKMVTICTASLFPLKPSSTADRHIQPLVATARNLFVRRQGLHSSLPYIWLSIDPSLAPSGLQQWQCGRQDHQSKFVLKCSSCKDCTRHCLIQKKL